MGKPLREDPCSSIKNEQNINDVKCRFRAGMVQTNKNLAWDFIK